MRIAFLAALLASSSASAQKLELSLYGMSGTGLSAASGDGETLTARSPVFIDLEVGIGLDPDPAWEFTPGFIAEVEDRVSFGVNPQVKRVIRRARMGYYGTAGVPIFFRPYTLLGFEVGGGVMFWLTDAFALVGEVRSDFFFVGSDLQDDGMLAKFDVALGIRVGL